MTNYEVMFIMNPTLDEAARDARIAKIQDVIAADGEVGQVDAWGMRKLAYPIEKKTEGFYVVIEFKASPELPKELDRRLKITDDVMRHIIINKDAR